MAATILSVAPPDKLCCVSADIISLPSMDSETLRRYAESADDDALLPDDIPSDSEFDSYILGKPDLSIMRLPFNCC